MSRTEHRPAAAKRKPESEYAAVVVAVAASAGSLEPLKALVAALSPTSPAAIVIAQHVSDRSFLPEILRNHCRWAIDFAQSDVTIRPGHIYVCPPKRHVIVNPDATLTLSESDPRNFVRPSGDWLFDSVAASYESRSIGVVLSGSQNDGARGVRAIAAAGGTVVVQEPATCAYPEMPNASIATGHVHHVAPPGLLGSVLHAVVAGLNLELGQATFSQGFVSSLVF